MGNIAQRCTDMSINQAIVLLGFREAKVFFIGVQNAAVEARLIHDRSLIRICDSSKKWNGLERVDFFRDIVRFLECRLEWSIVGNRSNCFGLIMYICHKNLENRIVEVEAIDMSPDDEELLLAREYFVRND